MAESSLKRKGLALTGIAQWVEQQPEKGKVVGSIPSRGRVHAWVAGQVPSWGHARGN